MVHKGSGRKILALVIKYFQDIFVGLAKIIAYVFLGLHIALLTNIQLKTNKYCLTYVTIMKTYIENMFYYTLDDSIPPV